MKKRFDRSLASAVCALVALLMVILPAAAYADTYQDGTYTVGCSCEGGSGRGGVRGVEALVEGGAVTTLYITMSSANYDYCYDPVSGAKTGASAGGGNSVFTVSYPGTSFSFTADTTAMSSPHEITYTVTLDISGIPVVQPSEPSGAAGGTPENPSPGAAGGTATEPHGSGNQSSGSQAPSAAEPQTSIGTEPGDASGTEAKAGDGQSSAKDDKAKNAKGDRAKNAEGNTAKSDEGEDKALGAETSAEKGYGVHAGAIIAGACIAAAAVVAAVIIIRKRGKGK